jgi:hypothetical protein
MNSDEHGETTPLLQPQPSSDASEAPPLKVNRRFIIIWTVFLIVFLDFASYVSIPAQNAIFEKIICRQYTASLNGTGSPDGLPPFEDPCKSTPVQAELGDILGWKDTFEVLPGACGDPQTALQVLNINRHLLRPPLGYAGRSMGQDPRILLLRAWRNYSGNWRSSDRCVLVQGYL